MFSSQKYNSFIEIKEREDDSKFEDDDRNAEENYVKQLLNTSSFRSYMLDTYEIVPMLINRHRIR